MAATAADGCVDAGGAVWASAARTTLPVKNVTAANATETRTVSEKLKRNLLVDRPIG